jgi:hypothetical protein
LQSLPSAFFQPPAVEGALGSIGREICGVGFGAGGDDALTCQAAGMLVRTGTGAGPRFSLPVSTTTPFRLIRSPGKNSNQNAFGLNSAIKSERTRFVSVLRLNLIKNF